MQSWATPYKLCNDLGFVADLRLNLPNVSEFTVVL